MKILFMGTPDFAVASLKKIHSSEHEIVGIVTSQDNIKAKAGNRESEVKKFAIEKNLLVFQPENLNDLYFQSEIKKLSPDLIVVVAFKLLPREIWQIPKYGTINLHASLLPDYRGAAPINWAIINGEKETGVTTFFIDDKVDTGAIILQKKEVIYSDDTFTTLYNRLKNIGSDLIIETIFAIENQRIVTQIQKNIKAPHLAPKIATEDCEIDWYFSDREGILNFVRGMTDTPGAFSILDGKKIKIFKVAITSNEDSDLLPGEILCDKNTQSICVGVSGKFLEIKELQMEGKSRMSTKDFLQGNIIKGFFRKLVR